MMHQESLLYVWIIVAALAAVLASLLVTPWVIVKGFGTYLRRDHGQSEGYVVRGPAAKLNVIRSVVGTLAIFLAILALWILGGELTSPRVGYFPSSPDEADAMYAVRGSAITAAKVGLIRGDLWTVAAITTATPLLFGATGGSRDQASQADIESMRAIANRAARLSPHDPRAWLVLAGLEFRGGGSDHRGTEALKLSYYTGPNDLSLMPLRLLLAVGSNAISDQEVQSLVPLDVQEIVMRRPELKPSIALAYKNAVPKGREIIEAALKKADPNFLATIAAPRRPGK